MHEIGATPVCRHGTAGPSRLRYALLGFGLLLAVAASPVHAAANAPAAQPPLPSAPRPPAVLPALAEDATVRAATAAYTHTPPTDHPRRVVTNYRAETLEPATAPRTASSWRTFEFNSQGGLAKMRAHTGYAVRSTGKPGGGGITIAIVENARVVSDNDEIPGHPEPAGRAGGERLRARPRRRPPDARGRRRRRKAQWIRAARGRLQREPRHRRLPPTTRRTTWRRSSPRWPA